MNLALSAVLNLNRSRCLALTLSWTVDDSIVLIENIAPGVPSWVLLSSHSLSILSALSCCRALHHHVAAITLTMLGRGGLPVPIALSQCIRQSLIRTLFDRHAAATLTSLLCRSAP